jgi:hypothetical protein
MSNQIGEISRETAKATSSRSKIMFPKIPLFF